VCAVAVFQPDCFKKRQNQLLRPATHVQHQLGRPRLSCPLHFQSATKLCISKVGPSLPCKAHISSTHYIHAHTTYLSFRATSIRRNFAFASNHILPYEKSRMQRNPLPDCHYPFKEDTKALITPYQIHNFRTSFQIDVSTPPTVDEIKNLWMCQIPDQQPHNAVIQGIRSPLFEHAKSYCRHPHPEIQSLRNCRTASAPLEWDPPLSLTAEKKFSMHSWQSLQEKNCTTSPILFLIRPACLLRNHRPSSKNRLAQHPHALPPETCSLVPLASSELPLGGRGNCHEPLSDSG
jgi:hypothetical protein